MIESMESNDAPVSSQIFTVNGHLEEIVKHAPGGGAPHFGGDGDVRWNSPAVKLFGTKRPASVADLLKPSMVRRLLLALFLVLAWPLARVFVNDPESIGTHPDGVPPSAGSSAKSATAEEEMGARRVLRSKEFWLISTGHSSALAIVGAVSVHFVIFVGSTLEMAVTAAAAMFTVITVCQMLGQAAGGFLGDRYDKRWLAGGGMAEEVVVVLPLQARSSGPAWHSH